MLDSYTNYDLKYAKLVRYITKYSNPFMESDMICYINQVKCNPTS